MPSAPMPNPLEASSYHLPGGGSFYAPLRARTVATAVAMGYDEASMIECGIHWGEDQDPFGHVATSVYPRYFSACNLRVVEGFAAVLGNENWLGLMEAKRGIGVLVRSYAIRMREPAVYPDALLVANRITEVLPDRYHGITSIWSLRRQTLIAEMNGYVVFYDHDKKKPADLIKAGGKYAELHQALTDQVKRSDELVAKWEKEHGSKAKVKL